MGRSILLSYVCDHHRAGARNDEAGLAVSKMFNLSSGRNAFKSFKQTRHETSLSFGSQRNVCSGRVLLVIYEYLQILIEFIGKHVSICPLKNQLYDLLL